MQTRLLYLAAVAWLGLTASGLALAIQPATANQPIVVSNSVATSAVIERGGTVNAVDWRNRNLTVDNVSFAISASPVVVHGLAGKRNAQVADLKPGMQIRFNTSKQNFSATDQVIEIWVTASAAKAIRK